VNDAASPVRQPGVVEHVFGGDGDYPVSGSPGVGLPRRFS